MDSFDNSEKEKEEELNDITAYYGGAPDPEADAFENSGAAAAESAEAASGKIPETDGAAHADAPADNGAAVTESPEAAKPADGAKKRAPWLYIVSAAAALFIIAGGFAIGRFVVPISEKNIDAAHERMLKTDAAYIAAKAEGEALESEIETLSADNDRIEETFNDVVEYEKQLDDLTEEYNGLDSRIKAAQKDADDAQAEYDSAQQGLDRLRSRKITLSPGTYTVGTHIPDGTYLVTGSGTILTAGTDKTLKINMSLDKTTPYRCELADGDTIKLSCEAEFAYEED